MQKSQSSLSVVIVSATAALVFAVACTDDAAAPGPTGDVGGEDTVDAGTQDVEDPCQSCSSTAPCDPPSAICLCGANEVQLDLCIDGCCLSGQTEAICKVACCDPEVEIARQCEPSADFCTIVSFDCVTESCGIETRSCDDADPCTVDTCDGQRGVCVNQRVTTTPDEGTERGQCENGVDDDCDGFIDSADRGCGECFDDADCVDENPCTLARCVNGACRNTPVEGAECDDGATCNFDDVCDALGVCAGTPVDLDDDGFGDADCGGLDCNDADPSVSPATAEGPPGGPTCDDSIDNNCSGAYDTLDVECIDVPCPSASWCKERPTPRRFEVRGSTSAATDAIWVVGERGALWRWDGSRWHWESPTGAVGDISAVWASSPGDVWAAGDGGRVFRQAATWTSLQTGLDADLRAIGGNSADDLWAVGDRGAVARWSANAWTVVTAAQVGNPALTALAESGPGQAFAAGAGGALFHLDGRGVEPVATPIRDVTAEDINVLTTLGDGEVWGGTDGGSVLRWDGSTWSVTPLPVAKDVVALWGTSFDSVWLQAEDEIRHFDGLSWSAPASLPDGAWVVAGDDAGPTWAVAQGSVWYTRQQGAWVRYSDSLEGETGKRGLWASSPDDVWAQGGREFMLHYSGTRWTPHRVGWNNVVSALWATAADDVWGVGGAHESSDDGIFVHWDGAAWSVVAYVPEAVFTDLHGVSDLAIWLVGSPAAHPDRGVIYVWDGRELTLLRETAFPIAAVWVDSPANIWVAGDHGALHFDQNQWVDVPTTTAVNDLWMSPSGTVWAAAGEGCDTGTGQVLTATANAWVVSEGNLNDAMTGIWGSDDQDVWAAGCQQARHFGGSGWSADELGPDSATSIVGVSGHYWIGGPRGEILHRQP